MDDFSVVFKPSVEKDLRHLPKATVARVMKHLGDLKINPFPRQAVKLSASERLYRIRVGDYRVVYEVDVPASQVIVHYVRHRRAVYRTI